MRARFIYFFFGQELPISRFSLTTFHSVNRIHLDCDFENCRPLLKLVDRLLLVGMLRNEDVFKMLIMINPETWDPTFDKGKPTRKVALNINK